MIYFTTDLTTDWENKKTFVNPNSLSFWINDFSYTLHIWDLGNALG